MKKSHFPFLVANFIFVFSIYSYGKAPGEKNLNHAAGTKQTKHTAPKEVGNTRPIKDVGNVRSMTLSEINKPKSKRRLLYQLGEILNELGEETKVNTDSPWCYLRYGDLNKEDKIAMQTTITLDLVNSKEEYFYHEQEKFHMNGITIPIKYDGATTNKRITNAIICYRKSKGNSRITLGDVRNAFKDVIKFDL